MTTRADVVAEARTWLGTPWQHQQSLKGVATDCLGLISGVALNLGLEGAAKWRADERMRGYTKQPVARLVLAACDDYLDPLSLAAIELAAILWLRREDATHFAIVSALDPMYIIHGDAVVGERVVENRVDELCRSRIYRAYRFRGLSQ